MIQISALSERSKHESSVKNIIFTLLWGPTVCHWDTPRRLRTFCWNESHCGQPRISGTRMVRPRVTRLPAACALDWRERREAAGARMGRTTVEVVPEAARRETACYGWGRGRGPPWGWWGSGDTCPLPWLLLLRPSLTPWSSHSLRRLLHIFWAPEKCK